MGEEKDPCDIVAKFIHDVKQRKISGSYNIAISTVELLKKIITQTEWKTAREIMTKIEDESKHVLQTLPMFAAVENMIHRILKIIREEYINGLKVTPRQNQPPHLLILPESDKDYKTIVPELRELILEHIAELEVELENSAKNIVQQACELIHPNDIILTIGKSSSVEAFLKAAAAEHKFEVMVAECAPFCLGHEVALQLAHSKIKTTLIADSAVFALMPEVKKVILGTHSVMANGSLRAVCGSHSVALAAQHYSVPVFVLAPVYKISPRHRVSCEQNEFKCLVSPEGVLNYSDGAILSKVHVYNPLFDYVPSKLVSLYITNRDPPSSYDSENYIPYPQGNGGYTQALMFQLYRQYYADCRSNL